MHLLKIWPRIGLEQPHVKVFVNHEVKPEVLEASRKGGEHSELPAKRLSKVGRGEKERKRRQPVDMINFLSKRRLANHHLYEPKMPSESLGKPSVYNTTQAKLRYVVTSRNYRCFFFQFVRQPLDFSPPVSRTFEVFQVTFRYKS